MFILILWSPFIFSKENQEPLESEQPHLTVDVVQNAYFFLDCKLNSECVGSNLELCMEIQD